MNNPISLLLVALLKNGVLTVNFISRVTRDFNIFLENHSS